MDRNEHLAKYGRPGFPWRGITIATWIAVICCVIAIAVSSRMVGRPMWWLGAPNNDVPTFYIVVPAAIMIAPLEGAFWRSRSAVSTSVVCSLALIAIAIPDLATSPGVAIALCVVGFAALMQSIALVLVARQYR